MSLIDHIVKTAHLNLGAFEAGAKKTGAVAEKKGKTLMAAAAQESETDADLVSHIGFAKTAAPSKALAPPLEDAGQVSPLYEEYDYGNPFNSSHDD